MRKVKMQGRVYRFRMRVPTRFAAVETRKEIDVSLKTGDIQKAEAKASELETRLLAMWEAKIAGESADYEAIVKYCQTMGFAYRSVPDQTDDDFLKRMREVSSDEHHQAKALLGTIKSPGTLVSKMPERYEAISAYRLQKKNAEQLRIWRIPFKRAASSFIEKCGDLHLEAITTREALIFRDHMRASVEAGKIVPNTANRMFGSMQTMFKEITTDQKQPLPNPFENLRLKETKTKGRRKAIPPEMIQRILAPGAMEKLNAEARDVVLICLNTGCRPSEVCGVLPEHIHLEDDTPHFDLVEEGRELKSGASIRKVVLLGVALEAMARRKANKGFPRYKGKHNSMTTAINKYLKNNKILDEGFSLYGLRHSFQDRVTSQNLTERVSAELMGHEIRRERYGDGPDLAMLSEALKPISYF